MHEPGKPLAVVIDSQVRSALDAAGIEGLVVHITRTNQFGGHDAVRTNVGAEVGSVETIDPAAPRPEAFFSDAVIGNSPPKLRPAGAAEIAKMTMECKLLEQANVRNGTKSIAIWLFYHWKGPLLAEYGEHHDPATIRRWRAVGRRKPSSRQPG